MTLAVNAQSAPPVWAQGRQRPMNLAPQVVKNAAAKTELKPQHFAIRKVDGMVGVFECWYWSRHGAGRVVFTQEGARPQRKRKQRGSQRYMNNRH